MSTELVGYKGGMDIYNVYANVFQMWLDIVVRNRKT